MPTENKVTRKLRAILSADVKGYSILMADDEVTTVHTINSYRVVMTDLIQGYNGGVVDAKGDNVLAGFSSVVDAVQCAVDIQKKLALRNADLPEGRKMEFRIGVNLGDVIDEEGTLYGDGVNVAARLEGLADPGGIAISGTAFDHVRDKLDLGYQHLGEVSVKNIPRPIRAYKVLIEPEHAGKLIGGKSPTYRNKWPWLAVATVTLLIGIIVWQFYQKTITPEFEPASVDKMAFPLPDKPSIAVLPFDNFSENLKDEFIADGITESIITALSKVPQIFVIARNSTFIYKGKPTKVQKIAEDLGVQYVLEGSLQKVEDQLRINAQLIDAINGKHLWAEKFDRKMNDLFALQDEITKKIITALNVKLTHGEIASVYSKGTNNLEAYLSVLQGLRYIRRAHAEDIAYAKKMAKEAIALDSNYAAAYYLQSWCHMADMYYVGSDSQSVLSPKVLFKLSIENAQKAISLDNSFAEPHGLLAWLYTLAKQHERGVAEAEAALALNPSSAAVHGWLALTLNYAGKHEEAIISIKKRLRYNPIPLPDILTILCVAYRDSGRYEEGISAAKKAVHLEPDQLVGHSCLASCYALLGKDVEAKAESAEVLRIAPNYSLSRLNKSLPYKDPAEKKLVIESLRKAGLPD